MSSCASFSVMRWSMPGLCGGSVISTSASRVILVRSQRVQNAHTVVGHESNDGVGALHPRADGQDVDPFVGHRPGDLIEGTDRVWDMDDHFFRGSGLQHGGFLPGYRRPLAVVLQAWHFRRATRWRADLIESG